tara:strand:- start:1283 stop:2725 length:1443 start_codon:yes stop_codon:yes gene_type:complete
MVTKLDRQQKGWPPARFFIFGLIVLTSIAVFIAGPFVFSDELSSAAVLILLVVGALATGVIPEQITILIFFLLAMLLAIASPQIVFSGFISGAFWLVFGGLIIGAAVETTGLGNRIAQSLIAYVRGSYMWVVATILLINLVLIFLMPSTLSRVVLLIPIIISISDQMGYSRGSKPANGLVMVTVLTAYLCSTSVLPANVPNNVLMGASETFLNTPIRYFEYFLLHFPILGALKAIIIWGAVVYLFKPENQEVKIVIGDTGSIRKSKTQLPKDEKRILILLVCALFLWATDTVHGITPAWVSLAVGIACLFPKFGVVSPSEFKEKVAIGPLLYVAGIIGIGAVVADSGLGNYLSNVMIEASNLSPDNPLGGFLVLSGISMLLSFFSTMPGVPAIMVPLAPDLQAASGLPLKTVVMTQVIGFSTVWLPYQVPPIIVGMQLAGVPMVAGIKVTFFIAILSIILLTPLIIIWWQFLGYLPYGII